MFNTYNSKFSICKYTCWLGDCFGVFKHSHYLQWNFMCMIENKTNKQTKEMKQLKNRGKGLSIPCLLCSCWGSIKNGNIFCFVLFICGDRFKGILNNFSALLFYCRMRRNLQWNKRLKTWMEIKERECSYSNSWRDRATELNRAIANHDEKLLSPKT